MSVAPREHYWTSRNNGEDPTNPEQPHHNIPFSLVPLTNAGTANGDYWDIDDGYYRISMGGGQYEQPDGTPLTAILAFYYPDTGNLPIDGHVLLELDNGSNSCWVESTGNAHSLRFRGAGETLIQDLDLAMAEDDAYITVVRLALDTTNDIARMWLYEATEDEMGESLEYTLTPAGSSYSEIRFGAEQGKIRVSSVYATHHGAYSPDELAQSSFHQAVLNTTGLAFRNLLRDSRRPYLKAMPDSSIVYGYDVSSSMIVRLAPPTIHVLVTGAESPEFSAISGTSIDQEYEIQVYVTTKGTDYSDAYRFGLRILGEIFDEAYTNTGLNATQDSLIGYRATLDTKSDNDEQVCVHRMAFTYRKREKMLTR